MLQLLLGATLLLLGAPRAVKGQQQHESQVTLSLNEFQDLFSSARLEEAERRLLDQRKIQEAQHKLKLQELENLKSSMQKDGEEQRNKVFPLNYQVLQHTATGYFNSSSDESGVEHDVASFELGLVLRIPSQTWTIIPLANTTSMVTSDWSVAWRADGDDDSFSPVDPVTSPDTLLLLKEEQQVLATNRSGLFSMKFKAHTRVGKTRNLNTLSLSSLLYPLSSFTLRIASDDSSHVRDFGVQPASALLQVEQSDGYYTDIKATLPLTADGIQVKWLDVAEESDEATFTTSSQEAEMPQVTAAHEVLHTVSEGMIVKSLHILGFEAGSETSLNTVEFLVHGKGLRVTSVLGHSLQSWSAEDMDDWSKLVRATFKSSHLDSSITLHVHTEMDGNADDDLAELPRMECKNVLRQVGHVAVVKEANIEVHEDKAVGVSRCEPSEISSQLRSNIDRPIILSYKYLNPKNSIVLNVKEHAAMETLEATVDRIHYKALVTDTHTAHSLILIMQSTKLQYLELFGLPSSASMFTVAVNSAPTKPVEGETSSSSILIPLLVGLDSEVANEGGSMRTSVELNYFSSHDSLGNNGTIHLAPPQLKLPVSILTAHLRLPEKYKYKFVGDFERVPRMEYPLPQALSYVTGKRVVEEDYEFSAVDDVWPDDSEPGKIGSVKIATPNIGHSFHFQRLLMVDAETSLDILYSKRVAAKEKSWLRKMLGL